MVAFCVGKQPGKRVSGKAGHVRTQQNKVKVVSSSSAAYMLIGHHRTTGEAAQVSLKDILV